MKIFVTKEWMEFIQSCSHQKSPSELVLHINGALEGFCVVWMVVFCWFFGWVVLFCFFNVWELRAWPLYSTLSSLCGPCSGFASVEAVPEFTGYLLRAAPAGISIRIIFTSWWTVSPSSHPAGSELRALSWKVWTVWSCWWEHWSQTHHSVYWNIGSSSYCNGSVSTISYSKECSCTETKPVLTWKGKSRVVPSNLIKPVHLESEHRPGFRDAVLQHVRRATCPSWHLVYLQYFSACSCSELTLQN